MDIGVISRGVKRPGSEFDHSPPFSPKVKNEWSYNTPPHLGIYAFMVRTATNLYHWLHYTNCMYKFSN
jgi:hypothetical protein